MKRACKLKKPSQEEAQQQGKAKKEMKKIGLQVTVPVCFTQKEVACLQVWIYPITVGISFEIGMKWKHCQSHLMFPFRI